MSDHTRTSRLIHYTTDLDTVLSILDIGFVLIPNKRQLINALLGSAFFDKREPQEFGMVSFTELPLEMAAAHRDRFGRYGIIVDWEWALANAAQRVIYLDDRGPLFDAFAWLFRLAKQELDRASRGKPSTRVLENKAMAAISRAQLYSCLLTLYEYMEPEGNSTQLEWRIVAASPLQTDADDKPRPEMIRERVATAKLWSGSIGSVKLMRDDVVGFVCPKSERDRFAAGLPREYSRTPIVTYRDAAGMGRYARVHDRALASHRLREREIVTIAPPPGDTMYVHRIGGRYRLPTAERITSASVSRDEVVSEIGVQVEYVSTTGLFCEFIVPIKQALYLMSIIRSMQKRLGLDATHPDR